MPLQKTATWIQSPFMSFPTKHRMKNEEIHRIFQELPEEEKLIDGNTAYTEYTHIIIIILYILQIIHVLCRERYCCREDFTSHKTGCVSMPTSSPG